MSMVVRRISFSAAVLLTAVAAYLLPVGWVRVAAALGVVWVWPAIAAAPHLPGPAAERHTLAWAGAPLFTAVLSLLLHYLPGPFPAVLLTGGLLAATLAGIWRRPTPKDAIDLRPFEPYPNWPRSVQIGGMVLAVVIILGLRLPNYTYKELQGDEGLVLQRAAAGLVGEGQGLFLHQKGPVELMVPTAVWAHAERLSVETARLPFLAANLLSLAALWCVVRRMHGRETATVAVLLLGIVGFHVAFGRILQYQSFVLLWCLCALLCAQRYAARPTTGRELVGAALFLAGGLLAHYDAILFAPAVGYLGLMPLWGYRYRRRHAYTAAAAGTAVLLLFYLPFAAHPTFTDTVSYLLNDRIGVVEGELTGGRTADVWRMLTFYNHSMFVVGLGLLAAVGAGWLVWRTVDDVGWSPALLRRPHLLPGLLLWLVPVVFYTQIVTDPRTHIYTFFPGLVIPVAWALTAGWAWLPQRPIWVRPGVLTFVSGWLLVGIFYSGAMFTQAMPERQRNWSTARPIFSPTTWREPPRYGLFGFPYRAGWATAGQWLTTHLPPGAAYGTNEEPAVTDWYTAHAPRTGCPTTGLFLLAENVQDEMPYDAGRIAAWHLHAAVVDADGRSRIQMLRPTMPDGAVASLPADGRTWRTAAEAARPTTLTAVDRQAIPAPTPVGDGRISLRGYRIDDTATYPGGYVDVILYWRTDRPLVRNRQTFIHLVDSATAEIVSQHDSAPDCAARPTSGWEMGEIVRDMHRVPVPADLAGGQSVQVRAGMYDLLTLAPLPTADSAAGLIPLPPIRIKE